MTSDKLHTVLSAKSLWSILFLAFGWNASASLTATDSSRNILSNREAAVQKPSLFSTTWAPIGVCLISVDLMRDSAKYGLQTLLRQPFNGYETDADDYIQYAPIVMMYTADIFKVKARNTPWNQTKFLALSEIGTSAIVQLLKYSFKIRRPNNGAYNAYPSGHTSQAFVASQVLFNEYRHTAPLLAYSGFLFSIPTGALRIVNNRHWVPDVLLGAGIGMLVTNLVYHYEPFKNWDPFKNKKKKGEMGFVPDLRDDYIGGYFTYRF